MDKLHRVLSSRGLSWTWDVMRIAAANVISFNPQTVEMRPGSSQDLQIVMDSVPDGLSGFNITVSILDPQIAEFAAVSFPGWEFAPKEFYISFEFGLDKKVIDLNDQVHPGDTNVLLGTVTLTSKKAGTTDLSIPKTKMSDDNGSLINPVVTTGKVNVTSVQKTTPTITWNNPADIIYGTALSSTQLNAIATNPTTGASVPGTFAYTPAAGTVLNAGTQTLHVDLHTHRYCKL